jgi:hypothetical protein
MDADGRRRVSFFAAWRLCVSYPLRSRGQDLIRSGWHGVIRIARGYNDQFITVAADQGHAPQVGWIEIGEGRKWRLRGLTVSPSLAPSPLERVPHDLVMLGERGGEESAELVVEDCFIYTALDASGWTAQDWVQKTASGIWLGRHGRGHVARNNYILNTRFGINLCAPDCLAEGNVVANFSADGIRVTRDGQTVLEVARENGIKIPTLCYMKHLTSWGGRSWRTRHHRRRRRRSLPSRSRMIRGRNIKKINNPSQPT